MDHVGECQSREQYGKTAGESQNSHRTSLHDRASERDLTNLQRVCREGRRGSRTSKPDSIRRATGRSFLWAEHYWACLMRS
jgi:hypothetical protein